MGSQDREMTSSCLGQFPPQTAASPDEQKVFALWESGDMSDQVRCFPPPPIFLSQEWESWKIEAIRSWALEYSWTRQISQSLQDRQRFEPELGCLPN